MLPNECEALALKLMDQYGLLKRDPPWRLEYDLAYNRFGQCHETKRLIRLSKVLVTFNDIEQCTDTILHEIAHALVGNRHGHDNIWKHCASKIGAKPKACFGTEVTQVWVNNRINIYE